MQRPVFKVTPKYLSASEKPALYEMLSEVWPSETTSTLDRRWWWTLPEPPLVVVEDEAGNLAGMCGRIPFTAYAASEERRGSWIVDFFVRQQYQGRGIGKSMVRFIEKDFDFLASLNQTDAAYATFAKCGWSARSFVPFFLDVSPRLSRLVSKLRGPGWRGNTDVYPATSAFGTEFDDLWQRLRSRFGAVSLRDAETLARRFGSGQRDYAVVTATLGGRLEGYAVLRELPPGSIRSFPHFHITMVSDYLADPARGDVFAALMYETARWSSLRGSRFVLCMTSHAEHQRVLRRNLLLSAYTPIIGAKLRKLAVPFTHTPPAPSRDWHLTPFDCDLDLLFAPA